MAVPMTVRARSTISVTRRAVPFCPRLEMRSTDIRGLLTEPDQVAESDGGGEGAPPESLRVAVAGADLVVGGGALHTGRRVADRAGRIEELKDRRVVFQP